MEAVNRNRLVLSIFIRARASSKEVSKLPRLFSNIFFLLTAKLLLNTSITFHIFRRNIEVLPQAREALIDEEVVDLLERFTAGYGLSAW